MFEELSKRELEVLDLYAHGFSAGDIQEKLGISKHTAHTHLIKIYEKMIDVVGVCGNDSSKHSKKDVIILLYLRYKGVLSEDWYIKV